MSNNRLYTLQLEWTGNRGTGTLDYRSYSRDHIISREGKPDIAGSADPSFRGNAARYNPEELLVAALSSCHMLWFLHLCADAGIVVTGYTDSPTGTLIEQADGGGKFKEVVLYPKVIITDGSRIEQANALHPRAHELCFIARSCNFPVHHQPVCRTTPADTKN